MPTPALTSKYKKEPISVVAKNEFEKVIEEVTGESVSSLRNMPIDERRRITEKKFNRRMLFPSLFPIIGRGNVLGNCTISREKIESQLDEVLK